MQKGDALNCGVEQAAEVTWTAGKSSHDPSHGNGSG